MKSFLSPHCGLHFFADLFYTSFLPILLRRRHRHLKSPLQFVAQFWLVLDEMRCFAVTIPIGKFRSPWVPDQVERVSAIKKVPGFLRAKIAICSRLNFMVEANKGGGGKYLLRRVWSPYSPFTGAYWPSCKHFWTKWYQSGEKNVNLDGFDKSQKEKFRDPHSGRLSFSLLHIGDSVAGVIFSMFHWDLLHEMNLNEITSYRAVTLNLKLTTNHRGVNIAL